MKTATAQAPATVANVAVGFDVLGFAVEGIGDTVSVSRTGTDRFAVTVELSDGDASIPVEPEKNTASAALLAMGKDLDLRGDFRVRLTKRIPVGSGMGGSAASAVGAVAAANTLLENRLPTEDLLPYALVGEAVASGDMHPDNVAPCLFGGLTASLPGKPPHVVHLPVPPRLTCVLVHPRLRVDTRDARAALSETVSLRNHVKQTGQLVGFIAACFRGDPDLLERCLADDVVEPQRAHLVPGFAEVQRAARGAGAMGCSLSGSGPSVFAWVRDADAASSVRDAMEASFRDAGVESDAWVSPVDAPGVSVTVEP